MPKQHNFILYVDNLVLMFFCYLFRASETEEYEASMYFFKTYWRKKSQLLNQQGNGDEVEVGWPKESHERYSTSIKEVYGLKSIIVECN